MSSRRLLLPLLVIVNLVIFAERAHARQGCFADSSEPQQAVDGSEIVPPASTMVTEAMKKAIADAAQTPQLQRPRPLARTPLPKSTLLLGSLYASTAILQGLDVHSTFKGLDRGAAEANPIMGGLVKNRPMFIVAKSLVSAGTIVAARQVAKKNKIAAVATLVGLNAMYGYVVNHNYALARRLQ
jgi:Domain of unknown function (DUF5658)